MTPAVRALLQAVGLGLFLGPLLATVINGTNPFGAVTYVLAATAALLWVVATCGTRVLHTYIGDQGGES